MTTNTNPPDPPSVRAARRLASQRFLRGCEDYQTASIIDEAAQIIAAQTRCDSLSSELERARGLLEKAKARAYEQSRWNNGLAELHDDIQAFLAGKGGV